MSIPIDKELKQIFEEGYLNIICNCEYEAGYYHFSRAIIDDNNEIQFDEFPLSGESYRPDYFNPEKTYWLCEKPKNIFEKTGV